LRWAMGGLLGVVPGVGLGGESVRLEVDGLDQAEGQQPGRLAVFAGAVGFDKAAVGGLTAAVLLDLALELLQRGTPHSVHLLPGGLRVGGGGASVLEWGSGFALAHRALGGTLGER
jgi:hypothetical protein